MGDFARACRNHPGHPDYEANLAWARFRVQVAAGKDQRESAIAERREVEKNLAGSPAVAASAGRAGPALRRGR